MFVGVVNLYAHAHELLSNNVTIKIVQPHPSTFTLI